MELTRIIQDETEDGTRPGARAWIVSGEHGAVQIVLSKMEGPDWQFDQDVFPAGWSGTYLGYHAPTPLGGEDETEMDCPLLPGGRCFYSGSGLPVMDIARVWAAAGFDDAVIWEAAELAYRVRLAAGGQDDLSPKGRRAALLFTLECALAEAEETRAAVASEEAPWSRVAAAEEKVAVAEEELKAFDAAHPELVADLREQRRKERDGAARGAVPEETHPA
ncbi:hypothetical protein Ppa06_57280 [Planomonospora parontospora subsp. parontospora]|uniref:Uncharacterized protein n=3 Tax=Planomonospora parontospora TaxID=58119 RepID=A0AA37BLX9_9ACTN|nr:hypothetical protein [Planomonospora parontospora]GGK90941.1 hypothetical protein GCM10010126_58020 [Planomonospora parontospora]GII11930.1 hypothetical protein Ppa06_57280 [Planomonospora parontospora subsp. parontospora]